MTRLSYQQKTSSVANPRSTNCVFPVAALETESRQISKLSPSRIGLTIFQMVISNLFPEMQIAASVSFMEPAALEPAVQRPLIKFQLDTVKASRLRVISKSWSTATANCQKVTTGMRVKAVETVISASILVLRAIVVSLFVANKSLSNAAEIDCKRMIFEECDAFAATLDMILVVMSTRQSISVATSWDAFNLAIEKRIFSYPRTIVSFLNFFSFKSRLMKFETI